MQLHRHLEECVCMYVYTSRFFICLVVCLSICAAMHSKPGWMVRGGSIDLTRTLPIEDFVFRPELVDTLKDMGITKLFAVRKGNLGWIGVRWLASS